MFDMLTLRGAFGGNMLALHDHHAHDESQHG
jgi:hypothetical protein